MKTLGYITGVREIKIGEEYYFGELWDGCGDGEELLESGSIEIINKDLLEILDYCFDVVEFDILETDEDILKTRVKVKDIF